jgi:hypothetical protein
MAQVDRYCFKIDNGGNVTKELVFDTRDDIMIYPTRFKKIYGKAYWPCQNQENIISARTDFCKIKRRLYFEFYLMRPFGAFINTYIDWWQYQP